MTWDWAYAASILPDLLYGAWVTIGVTLASSVIALGGGLLIAIAGVTGGRAVHWAIRILIDLLRGVPILVLLYVGFYVLPQAGITLSALPIGIGVLGVVYAAFCSEVYRGALVGIPPGLRDAACALGLSPRQVWQLVLVPLMMRRAAPALMNYVLVLFKQSAFLFALGIPVLLGKAQEAGYASFRYLEPFTMAGLLYLAMNLPFVWLLSRVNPAHGHSAADRPPKPPRMPS